MFNVFGSKAEPAVPAPADLRQLPAGLIERDGQCVSATPDLIALAVDGWTIKQRIDALQKELKTVTEKLENSLGAGAALAVDNVCRVTFSERTTFKLMDPHKCSEILGGRFGDLVDTVVDHTPTDKLKDMLLDPDHPLAESLRACFAIKTATSVTFRPGKTL